MYVCVCVHVRENTVFVPIARGWASNSPESGIGSATNTLTFTISFQSNISIR